MKTAFGLNLVAAWVVAIAWTAHAQPAAAGNNSTSTNAAPITASVKRVREPAVAGLFYPKDKDTLRNSVDMLLEAASTQPLGGLKALICPHAGYVFSGRTAAIAYKAMAGLEIDTVIIMAPSHYAAFQGISVSRADAYATPLGQVEVSAKARSLSNIKPFISEPRCLVQRPSWWRQAPFTPPPPGEDTPETWEHAVEVQVPFLQRILPAAKILPLVFGEVDATEAARVLAQNLDDKTLIVVSTDLSHYKPYNQAKALDESCIQAICGLDAAAMQSEEACGKGPVLTLIHLAKLKGWKTQKLDYRNSGDAMGDKAGVVGYAAIAFYEPQTEGYSKAEQKQLLELARQTVTEVVQTGSLPKIDPSALPHKFSYPKGCFVTLTKKGLLRGCIGDILPRKSLYISVMENARNAALQDPRFRPVQPSELGEIEVEVSVLTEPRPLAFNSPDDLLAKLRPKRDGVVLQVGAQGATYLPQVWEQIPDRTEFLNHLAEKAGCAASAWRDPEAKVLIYQVEAFKESKQN